MKYSSYRAITEAVKNLEPFRGNTLTGYYDSLGNYIIKSYWTEIARVGGNSGTKTISSTKYSQTTSRQQSLIKRAWGLA